MASTSTQAKWESCSSVQVILECYKDDCTFVCDMSLGAVVCNMPQVKNFLKYECFLQIFGIRIKQVETFLMRKFPMIDRCWHAFAAVLWQRRCVHCQGWSERLRLHIVLWAGPGCVECSRWGLGTCLLAKLRATALWCALNIHVQLICMDFISYMNAQRFCGLRRICSSIMCLYDWHTVLCGGYGYVEFRRWGHFVILQCDNVLTYRIICDHVLRTSSETAWMLLGIQGVCQVWACTTHARMNACDTRITRCFEVCGG